MNAVAQQMAIDEQALISAAFAGDRNAFGKLVHMYQKPVYRLCMRYMKNEEARDIAQDVFIKAFVNRQRFSQDKAVLPWLLTIAKNQCIDKLRKYGRETQLDMQAHEPVCPNQNVEQQITSKQTLQIVETQMNRLPEGQREAIVLHHVEGLAYKEISDVMDVPEGTVMTWIHRGRKAIIQALHRTERINGGKHE